MPERHASCPVCGYKIDKLDPCPECGTPVSRHQSLRAGRRRVKLYFSLWVALLAVIVVPDCLYFFRLPVSFGAWLIIEIGFDLIAGVLGAVIAAFFLPKSSWLRLICAVAGFVATILVVLVLRVLAADLLQHR